MNIESGGKLSLTQDRLRELVSYDPDTGIFVWRKSRGPVAAGDSANSINALGYVQIQIDGYNYSGHRLAWLYVHGEWPNHTVDHMNGKRSDNRIANLRDVEHQVNLQNQRRASSSNKHGVLGVSPSGNRWRAYLVVGQKQKHLGCFSTKEEAYEAHLAGRREYMVGSLL